MKFVTNIFKMISTARFSGILTAVILSMCFVTFEAEAQGCKRFTQRPLIWISILLQLYIWRVMSIRGLSWLDLGLIRFLVGIRDIELLIKGQEMTNSKIRWSLIWKDYGLGIWEEMIDLLEAELKKWDIHFFTCLCGTIWGPFSWVRLLKGMVRNSF